MSRYVAFLRAINVGGRVVKMDQLRALFEAMRLRNVETFIASGNVLFDTRSDNVDSLERRIEKRLEGLLGYEVVTFVRTPEEIAAAAAYAPFGDPAALGPVHALYVGFLKTAPSEEAKQKLLSYRTKTDDLDVQGREVYWRAVKSLRESLFSGALLEKTLGPATMRNVSTVRKLAAKLSAE
ncbi:MAG: DUF1697 domain-containing protein [Gemmatimonadaceae bacterium]